MNICFVANFYKTYFFLEVAKQLADYGIDVYWIIPKESQYRFLTTLYDEKKLLLVDRSYINVSKAPVNDFKLNELIFGDRVLRHEIANGQKFLTNIQLPIYNFIQNNNISYVFGEVSWAHELLIHRMISVQKELQCHYYSMQTVRIPNGRFAFFEDEKLSKIVVQEKSHSENVQTIFPVEKPDYLKGNDAILKSNMSLSGRLLRLKRFFTGENIEKNDPNVNVGGFFRWWVPLREEFNRECYKLIRRRDTKDIFVKPYIFFGFHKQPEASVDVCGRYFENQLENIANLWRILPDGWNLVVKEHTNAIGDRSYRFYRKLKKYPGIILANEKIDSHLLIKNSQLVATNTGTMALEAALLGIPAITFSTVFFNRHSYCKHLNWTDLEKYSSIKILIEEIKQSKNNSEEYSAYILCNTYEGIIGDIFSNPLVIESENVAKVTNAISSII